MPRLTMVRVVSVLLVLVGLYPSTQPAWADRVQLDFEELSGMNYWAGNSIPAASQLGDTYLGSHGVRFASGSPFVAVVELGAGHATSGINGIGGSTPGGVLTYSSAYPIVISFFSPGDPETAAVTDYVRILGDLQGSPEQVVTLTAYDRAWNLLMSVDVADVGGCVMEISCPGIHAVEFLGPPDGMYGGVALDDLVFTSVYVPAAPVESSSWGSIKALFTE